MRVALLSAEAVPFAKTGGLADVAGALPKSLRDNGVDSFLILPLYEQIDRRHLRHIALDHVLVDWMGGNRAIRVWYSDAAGGAPAFLIEDQGSFERP